MKNKALLGQWVEEIQGGKTESISKIMKQFHALFMTIAARYSKDRQQQEDLVQESYVKIVINIHKYNNKGSFEGWMKRILINHCLDFVKKRRLKADYSIDDVDDMYTPVYESRILSDIHSEDIMDTLEEMPSGYRNVIQLYGIQGYSHKEIGEILGIKASSSRSQLTKAREKLRADLSARGLAFG